MFWIVPTQSDDFANGMGWAIMCVIIAGITISWVCTVVKKTIFLIYERNAIPVNNDPSIRDKTQKGKDPKKSGTANKEAKNKQEEEKEMDDIDEDKLDEEEIRQYENKDPQIAEPTTKIKNTEDCTFKKKLTKYKEQT